MEHPAASYKKMFESVEELNEPIPAVITGRKERLAKKQVAMHGCVDGSVALFTDNYGSKIMNHLTFPPVPVLHEISDLVAMNNLHLNML